MTQYLNEMCAMYMQEKEVPGPRGCNSDLIGDVMEHGENMEQPKLAAIPNWNGDNVERILRKANGGNICNAKMEVMANACATMEAVCVAKSNIFLCPPSKFKVHRLSKNLFNNA